MKKNRSRDPPTIWWYHCVYHCHVQQSRPDFTSNNGLASDEVSNSLSLPAHHFSSIWTSCKTVSSYVFCLSWGRKHCSSFLVLLREAIYKVTGVKIGYTYALGTRPHSGWISQFKKSPWPALPWTHHEHMTVCGYFANSSRQLSSYLSEGPCV